MKATGRSAQRRPRLADALACCLAVHLLLTIPAAGEPWRFGGDVRYYQFVRVDDSDGGRRDAELFVVRLKLEGGFSDEVSAEIHGVTSVVSPASPAVTSIVSGTTRRLFTLQGTVIDEKDLQVVMELDRLNVRWEREGFRLVAGRQAITWGVNYFWPALDLFAPFSPERIDREYKPGVDALRLTVALGSFSQIEVVAAGQGTSLQDDGSVAALARVNLGPADVGFMAGRFHRDTVVGGFVTANVYGTGLRGEIAFTDSGEPSDAALGREQFWRASVGLDRQLTPSVSVTAEIAWNGFGVAHTEDYRLVASADRVQRGEVNSLGQWYCGASLTWQAHPLLSISGTVLANLNDGSVLLLPHADWSLSDHISIVFGGTFGIGPGLQPDQNLGSEYGAVPNTLYGAVKAYF